MTDLEIAYDNLCIYDPRSPHFYNWAEDMGEDMPLPRNDCFCDYCFNGRDDLALIIIRLLEGKQT